MKKIICIDFDGVIHSYESGWKGIDTIPDAPVEGAEEFLRSCITDKEIEPIIYSSRSQEQKGVQAMVDYIEKHFGFDVVEGLKFAQKKPPAFLTIDDRAFHFEGKFPSVDWMKSFKPWNK